MPEPLLEFASTIARPRALVVGDLMLDRFIWGQMEASGVNEPYPVLRISREEYRVGGAAAVAIDLARRGFRVRIVSVTGGDDRDRLVRQLLAESGLGGQWIYPDATRATSVREHFMGPAGADPTGPILRVDKFERHPIRPTLADELMHSIWDQLELLDAIVVCDYGHGVCAGEFLPQLEAIAAAAGVPVVDGRTAAAGSSRAEGPCHAQPV
jgi:D-beta-D-heptose 7-phosphate kinase/D-beta-D-heptose 1-phosphate adenosyltransferase